MRNRPSLTVPSLVLVAGLALAGTACDNEGFPEEEDVEDVDASPTAS